MSIWKPQNSILWVGGITNEIMLFCLLYITKKHELLLLSSKGSLKVKLNPNQPVVCRNMTKLCSYILRKSISLRNVINEKHHSRKGVQSSTMEFYQVSEKSYFHHRSQYFLIQLKKIFFSEENLLTEELGQKVHRLSPKLSTSTISYKIFETNSSFHVKQRTMEKI